MKSKMRILALLILVLGTAGSFYASTITDPTLQMLLRLYSLGIFAIAIVFALYARDRLQWLMLKKEHATPYFLKGTGIGALVFAGIVLVVFIFGGLSFRDILPLKPGLLLLFLVGFFLQTACEEFLTRGIFFSRLREKGLLWAVVIPSIAFAALHLGNPNVSFLGLFNIFLFGVIMALVVEKTGSILPAWGLHFGWNVTESLVFNLPNSGMSIETGIFAFTENPNASSLLTGSGFGLEASVCTTLVFGLVILLIYQRSIKASK